MFLYIFIFCRFYERYGESSNQTTRDNFNTMSKKALKGAFKNKTDLELNLILCKIYLYLGHHYMDLHYYDRAISLAEKCRNLCIEIASSGHDLEVNVKKKSFIYNIG